MAVARALMNRPPLLLADEPAGRIRYPVVVKLEMAGIDHKSDVGGVRLDLSTPADVEAAFAEVVAAAAGMRGDTRARIQPYRPGLEMLVGALVHPGVGPLVSVGMGGVSTEVLGDVEFAPAPVGLEGAGEMIDRLRGRRILDGHRGGSPADVRGLAETVSLVSRALVGTGIREVELNPLIWDGQRWRAVDWLARE